jgi:Fe-S oxidoreductase
MPAAYRFFDAERCTACGECLARCRYLALPAAEARRAREQLRLGRPVPAVVEGCASCYACDAFCPEGLRPYEAILESWSRNYDDRGLPVRARFLMPHATPNLRSHLIDRLPADEAARVAQWQSTPRRMTGTVLYPGCNLLTLPYLTATRLLDGIAIHGRLEDCCGEMYFRMGLFAEVDRVARRLTAHYAAHAIEEMLFVCPACYNMFTHVLPEQFGARFDFRTRFLDEVLTPRLAAEGGISPVGRAAAIHDSCHARILGDAFLDRQRDLLRLLGVTPVESTADRLRGACCGIAAGCARQSPIDIARAALDALSTARRAVPSEVAVYCGGCHLVLSMIGQGVPGSPRVRHVLDYVREATGEGAPRATARARSAAAGVASRALPLLLSRKRFRIP